MVEESLKMCTAACSLSLFMEAFSSVLVYERLVELSLAAGHFGQITHLTGSDGGQATSAAV